MRKISGNLSLMHVVDVIQWAGTSKRTGTLILSHDTQQKEIFFQDGKIIFVWSDYTGERFSDVVEAETGIDRKNLEDKFHESLLLGFPFLGYLHSEHILDKLKLEEILRKITEKVLIHSLRWGTGTFEFTDELPDFVLNSPVHLETSEAMLDSIRKFDETKIQDKIDTDRILEEIHQRIRNGTVDLPPIPDIMQEIMTKLDNPHFTVDDIVTCITDQILISRIFKICNSPYYGRIAKVSNLKDAIVYIGTKALMSIITVHALSSFSPRNVEEIRKVLHHCLLCGMLAKELARQSSVSQEQAFVCGLLHDVGKTVMLDMIDDYGLSFSNRKQIIEEQHSEAGYLLAQKWNFSEEIQEVIRFHHAPEQASHHRDLVAIIHQANIIVNDGSSQNRTDSSPLQHHIQELLEKRNDIDKELETIV